MKFPSFKDSFARSKLIRREQERKEGESEKNRRGGRRERSRVNLREEQWREKWGEVEEGGGNKAEKRGRSPQAQFLRGMRAIHFSTLSFVRSFERERERESSAV